MPRVSLTIVQPLRPLLSDEDLDDFNSFVPAPPPEERHDEGGYFIRRKNGRGYMQSYCEGRPVCTDCGDYYVNMGCGEICDLCEDLALRLWGDIDTYPY